MLLLRILTAGLGRKMARLDVGLALGVVGLIAAAAFVSSAGTRGQAALRVELADLNVRQADQKTAHEELLIAFAQVTARVAALEQEAAARQLPGLPADVAETGSLPDEPVVTKRQKSNRKGTSARH